MTVSETGRAKDNRWWKLEEQPGTRLVNVVMAIMQRDGARRRTWLRAMRSTYVDEPYETEARDLMAELSYRVPDMRTPWPALRSGVDAMHAKIAKTHPRCLVLTEDGSYDLQTRAELLTQWLDGEFSRLRISEKLERVWLDCLLYGTGCLYVGTRNDMPIAERVWCGDLFVDPLEELYDSVRSMYRARPMDKGVLCEMFPQHAAAIEKAAPDLGNNDRVSVVDGEVSEMVMAYEGWRLADGPDCKGRHVIAIDKVTLYDDREWEGKRFPFGFVHWSRDPERFWGIGLVEQMLAPQAELDDIAQTNSETRHNFVPQLHVEDGADGGIQIEQIDNGHSRIYRRAAGTAVPVMLHAGPMFNDMAMLEETYIQRVYNLAGLSQLSVASQKPQGLNSGVAIANFTDVESERFATAGRSWERLSIDTGELLVDAAETICKSGASKAAKLRVMGGKDALRSVSYSEARFGDDPHEIRVFPVSQLSNSVSAKLDEIDRMVTSGLISDADDARELADLPDLKRYNSVASAGRRLVRKLVDRALQDGVAIPPNPYMPLDYLVQFGSLSADLAQEHDAPEDNVQLLRDLVQAAIDLRKQIKAEEQASMAAANAAAAPPPQMPMPPMMPPEMPAPTGAPMPPPPGGEPMPLVPPGN